MVQKYSIQRVSDETGLSIDTLRYYERIGLIPDIERADNGHRRYSDSDVEWIQFLIQLRETGMPLSQMKLFAELRKGGDQTVSERREMLEAHRQNLEEQVEKIERFMMVIDAKIARHKQHEQDNQR
jgi:DNA-binding transcriptional MerR regulator